MPFWGATNTHKAKTPTILLSDETVGETRERTEPAPAARVTTRDGAEPVAKVTTSIVSFRNMHQHGNLLVKYLEARKAIFVDALRWTVCEADGMEFDQYDTPFCRWIVLHQKGTVLGGVRMMPTTAQCGIYSYMLRDAQNGLLQDLPTDILFFPAPVEHGVWEATRFFITDVVSAQNRQRIQTLLFRAMSRTAMQQGATHVIGIVPAIWARWARRLGVRATPIGAKFSIDGTSSQAVLFRARDYLC